jgi:hypothetical protein
VRSNLSDVALAAENLNNVSDRCRATLDARRDLPPTALRSTIASGAPKLAIQRDRQRQPPA